ncbi:MAG: menaquinone biosynthetic enzyme MqnA/MqnD family protein [Phycisphaerae bacterium]
MTKHFNVGCVSYLNSKPLIEPLMGRDNITVHFAVPSALGAMIENNLVDAALLPVVDYQLLPRELLLVPAGAIGCDGPTLTVRLYSHVPPENITQIHADADSHTSVLLAQVILREFYHNTPAIVPTNMYDNSSSALPAQAVLLIGDKVINAAPPAGTYPWQLDLGEQWKLHTGLPFVFAMWMMPSDRCDPTLADILQKARADGAHMTNDLVARYAAERRWPADLAFDYFTTYLKYVVTPACRTGIETFFDLLHKHDLIKIHRKCRYLELS